MAIILKKIKSGIPIHRYIQKQYINLYDLKIYKIKLSTKTIKFLIKIKPFLTIIQKMISLTNQIANTSILFLQRSDLKK